jgi:hypothetical protein
MRTINQCYHKLQVGDLIAKRYGKHVQIFMIIGYEAFDSVYNVKVLRDDIQPSTVGMDYWQAGWKLCSSFSPLSELARVLGDHKKNKLIT